MIQLGIETAFLNGKLNMELPGKVDTESEKESKVCELRRTLYSLRTDLSTELDFYRKSEKMWTEIERYKTVLIYEGKTVDYITV